MESGYFVETDGILTNKLGITDAEELVSTEYRITDEKIGQVLANYHPLEFNIACLLDIHRQLFDTIYPFAGKIRDVFVFNSRVVFHCVDVSHFLYPFCS